MDTLREVLTRLQRQGSAVGHFNVADLVLLKAVVAAAVEVGVPVIVGASEGERDFSGTYDVPVFLNADHTHSLARAVEAARAGFDSVGVDFSALPFDQNVSRTRETVEAIKAINPAILAEGEIGDIGTGSGIRETVHNEFQNLTTPEESRQFVDSTGIDVLAPAVGNLHGMLESMVEGKTKKHLNIERIAQIKKASGVFLTLHGGSGTDDEDFLRAIAAGISIVHISTELRRSLDASLTSQPNQVVPYKIVSPVVESVKQVVSSGLKLFDVQRTSEQMHLSTGR
jgi:fructose-bisphosphate aldolase, class II